MATAAPNLSDYVFFSRVGGFVELARWSSITIRGNDRQEFLHKFCTNDIRRIAPGESCEAFITNVKGKVIGHGLMTRREGEFVFTTVPDQAQTLIAHLDRYIIREDVQLHDTTSERDYLLLAGDARARSCVLALAPTLAIGQSFQRPLVNGDGKLVAIPVRWIRWDLLGPIFCGLIEAHPRNTARVRETLIDEGIASYGEAVFHALRIEAGTPLFGVDFDDRNLPQEVGRNERAISFTKGCYLGQETVARIDALGHVNQQLAGVRFMGRDLPEIGAALTHGAHTVGHVTSATFSPQLQAPLALAMLRRDYSTVGRGLNSPIGDCNVVALPVPDSGKFSPS